MIPTTFPSRLNSMNGVHRWRARALSSVTGLTRWVDYIPIKAESAISPLKEMHQDSGGYISIDFVDSVAGLTVGVDYVNVFVDNAATDAWQCSNTGYIPYGVGYGATFSLRPNAIPTGGTFTRASNATTVNADGTLSTVSSGVLRSNDYSDDPTRPGIKIEPQATNLIVWSEDFNNAGWSKTGLTASQTAGQPAKLVESSANSGHNIGITPTVSANTYTYYVDAKAGERGWIILTAPNAAGNASAWFNLSAGTLGTRQANLVSSSIRHLGGGVYRCSVTTSLTTGSGALVWIATGDNVVSYQGDGISGIFMYRAQLETGSVATSYIPTTGAAATRAADVWTFPTSAVPGFNASSFSFVTHTRSPGVVSDLILHADDGTTANRIVISSTGPSVTGRSFVAVAGVLGADMSLPGVYSSKTLLKVGYSGTPGSYNESVNGFNINPNSYAGMPSNISVLRIGQRTGLGAGDLNGSIYALDYYPTALSSTDLQRLTA